MDCGMTALPELDIGSTLYIAQMPRPRHAATILPGAPPELISGIGPGLQAMIVGASFESISVQVGNRIYTICPLKVGGWTTSVVERIRRERTDYGYRGAVR
jgi:hypothetical protein